MLLFLGGQLALQGVQQRGNGPQKRYTVLSRKFWLVDIFLSVCLVFWIVNLMMDHCSVIGWYFVSSCSAVQRQKLEKDRYVLLHILLLASFPCRLQLTRHSDMFCIKIDPDTILNSWFIDNHNFHFHPRSSTLP